VHEFDGHIACDAASRSEIVLPLLKDGVLIGVLDIDSPVPDRFSERDEELLSRVVEVYIGSLAPASAPA
jgi:GAF domain-containing protein